MVLLASNKEAVMTGTLIIDEEDAVKIASLGEVETLVGDDGEGYVIEE
jgi:hypothetical protein